MILIIFGVLMLIGLVILHELGHFYAARKSGVEVEEFGIGFPPKAKSLGKKNGTEYTLNWLPLGGFVRLKGEHDSDTEKGTFGAAKLSDKVKIMVAGVVVNAVTAIILMSVVAAIALPQVLRNDQGEFTQFYVSNDSKIVEQHVVMSVVGDTEIEQQEGFHSPAAEAGLKDGDIILSLNKENCVNSEGSDPSCTVQVRESVDLLESTKNLSSESVVVHYIAFDDKEAKETTVQFRSQDEVEESERVATQCLADAGVDIEKQNNCPRKLGYFGVFPDDYIERRATWSAPLVGTVVSAQVIKETLLQFGAVIGGLFQGDTAPARENITGVVGIGYILGELADRGFIAVLFLTSVISLSLALMNILPIPALDGGRLFVTLLFRLLRKPLTKEVEERIHGSGFALLMVLFLLITILDVQRFILN